MPATYPERTIRFSGVFGKRDAGERREGFAAPTADRRGATQGGRPSDLGGGRIASTARRTSTGSFPALSKPLVGGRLAEQRPERLDGCNSGVHGGSRWSTRPAAWPRASPRRPRAGPGASRRPGRPTGRTRPGRPPSSPYPPPAGPTPGSGRWPGGRSRRRRATGTSCDRPPPPDRPGLRPSRASSSAQTSTTLSGCSRRSRPTRSTRASFPRPPVGGRGGPGWRGRGTCSEKPGARSHRHPVDSATITPQRSRT